MSNAKNQREFKPVNIAVLTVSDTRGEAEDKSGKLLVERLEKAGHHLHEKRIVKDNVYAIRTVASVWIEEEKCNVVITTGGTGITGRDSTPEAVAPLFDKTLDGFGEIFRTLSLSDVGMSSLQSRAVGGVANRTFIFCLPGSSGACKLGWDEILQPQLDYRTRPCNLVELMPRLDEK